ncbi:MAG TPA: response regulator [Candidatus Polarisedimenticolia bacterium]|jgi:signal transduction histidine kinase|nr:response regulator [Candidatus Polarisedimenticolia bacterium]
MGTPIRVLIVEDCEDDADLLVRELRRGGYEPIWERVDTPEAMAAAVSGQSWDIVISDYSMPRFSAPDALALTLERKLNVPFIIVSGTVGEEVAVEAMRAGAHDYILKGRLTRLCTAVARELRDSEIRRAHVQSQEKLRETRERLDRATQQLVQAEKMTALGELVAGVAHEVNNPLASIMGYTQLVLMRELSADVRRRLETVFSEAERAGKIVRNLLTFARKQPPERKYLGLNGIIEKTLELKAYSLRRQKIEVEVATAPDLPMTMLDFQQIQQVLLNLLNNSEQAMTEAGRGQRIRIGTAKLGKTIEMRISDDGPGIPPDIQARIFEPFFTTKKEGKGTGLGLSLCYGIIQEHGGTIRVESTPGQGTIFVIELPIVEEKGPAGSAGPETSPESGPSLRILIVDDEPNVQNMLAELLGGRGYKVDTASDVPEALRKIETNGHSLIITDMNMPRGTGKDVYQAVLEKSPSLARRVIFTTGMGITAETQSFVRETGNEMILKPFKIEDIERAIAAAMSN